MKDLCTNDLLPQYIVKNVLECGVGKRQIIYKLRFSAIAPCIALPPASMQSCAHLDEIHPCISLLRATVVAQIRSRRICCLVLEQNFYPCIGLVNFIVLKKLIVANRKPERKKQPAGDVIIEKLLNNSRKKPNITKKNRIATPIPKI